MTHRLAGTHTDGWLDDTQAGWHTHTDGWLEQRLAGTHTSDWLAGTEADWLAGIVCSTSQLHMMLLV